MTTKLRLLSVKFDTRIEPWELIQFRGAVAAKAGLEHEMFHNHDNESGGFHYRFPLIQYKQDHGHPMLVSINEGIEELHHFFSQPDWTLSMDGRPVAVRIASLDVKQYTLAVLDKTFRYHIRNWLALNEDNYATYARLTGMIERLFLLEKVLQNQVVGFLRHVNFVSEKPVEVKLLQQKDERWVSFKGVKMLAFSMEFTANVPLPDYVGLGKGCSIGWGVVKKLAR